MLMKIGALKFRINANLLDDELLGCYGTFCVMCAIGLLSAGQAFMWEAPLDTYLRREQH